MIYFFTMPTFPVQPFFENYSLQRWIDFEKAEIRHKNSDENMLKINMIFEKVSKFLDIIL